MAGSVNKVILIGNCGQDPEITNGTNGRFATLSIATSESWKDKASGERKEVTDWHRVKIFDENLVKIVEQYVKKGHKIYVEGKQKTRKYEKDGVTHYATEVVLSGFGSVLTMLTSSGGGARGDSPDDYGTPSSRPARAENRPAANNDMDDDIPF